MWDGFEDMLQRQTSLQENQWRSQKQLQNLELKLDNSDIRP